MNKLFVKDDLEEDPDAIDSLEHGENPNLISSNTTDNALGDKATDSPVHSTSHLKSDLAVSSNSDLNYNQNSSSNDGLLDHSTTGSSVSRSSLEKSGEIDDSQTNQSDLDEGRSNETKLEAYETSTTKIRHRTETTLASTTLHSTTLHSNTLHSTTLHSTTLASRLNETEVFSSSDRTVSTLGPLGKQSSRFESQTANLSDQHTTSSPFHDRTTVRTLNATKKVKNNNYNVSLSTTRPLSITKSPFTTSTPSINQTDLKLNLTHQPSTGNSPKLKPCYSQAELESMVI